MKIYIRSNYDVPQGWYKKSLEELEDIGYEMDPEYLEENKTLCEKNGLQLLGYAVNDDEELAFICKDVDTKDISLFESAGGRLYEIENYEEDF